MRKKAEVREKVRAEVWWKVREKVAAEVGEKVWDNVWWKVREKVEEKGIKNDW